ncbi:MAG: T9SS type A sorting domain-containing protein [Bacteroidota bacterium]
MKKLLLSLSFLLASVFGYAQITFERHYGGNSSEANCSALQTNDGGYILAGYTTSFGEGGKDIYLIRTNQFGDTLWTKTQGGAGDDEVRSIIKTNDNCYIITGRTSSFGSLASNILLMKLDTNGTLIWQKAYGGIQEEEGSDVIQTNDGGFAITGTTMSWGQSFDATFLLKTNNNGDSLWAKIYEKYQNNWGWALLQLPDGGYVITGQTKPSSNTDDIYLIRTNHNGDTLWTKTIGGALRDASSSIQKTNDNGFLIFGSTENYGAGNFDEYIVKTNSVGDIQWTKTYGGTNNDGAWKGIPTSDGGFATAGGTSSFGAGGTDVYLIKINSNGDTLWTRTFGSLGDESALSIKETNDGGFILAGNTNSFTGGLDFYLIKTDANGHVAGMNDYQSMNNRITIFPNPTTGKVNIQIPEQIGQTKTLEVFDCVGQLQLTKTDDFTVLDIIRLSRGLYFMVLTNQDNQRQTIKIIKE